MQSAEGAEERKQRKKLQNRLNQRARRSRIREQETQAKTDDPRPYQVDRWRYTYQHAADTDGEPVPTKAGERDNKAWLDILVAACQFKPSPTQDHLLHLIHVNVLRGLFDNKVVLLGLTSYLAKCDGTEGCRSFLLNKLSWSCSHHVNCE
ncbi:PIF1-like helicase [Hirsutella rhossiliensis]